MEGGKIKSPLVQIGEKIINIDEIALIVPTPSAKYHYGVCLRSGVWFERFSKEELQELIEIIQSHTRQPTA